MKLFESTDQSLRKSGGSAFYKRIRHINHPAYKLLVTLLLFAGVLFLYYTKIGCVWNYLFHIHCPGCGITRALFALLRGDVLASLKSHFMLLGIPVLYLYYLFDGKLFKNRKWNLGILIAILSGFLIRWILCLGGILPL